MKRAISILVSIMMLGGFCIADCSISFAKTSQPGLIPWSEIDEPELRGLDHYKCYPSGSEDFGAGKTDNILPKDGVSGSYAAAMITIKDRLRSELMTCTEDDEFWLDISDLGIEVNSGDYPYLVNPYVDDKRVNFGGYSMDTSGKYLSGFIFYLSGKPSEIKAWVNEVDSKVEDMRELIASPSLTDVDKALIIHDNIVSTCHYDTTYSRYNPANMLTENTGVCMAYALLFQYIMNLEGIECYTASSDAMNHAWNIIKINGKYYHIDTTWDDPLTDSVGSALHKYFMLSDTTISDSYHRHTGWNLTQFSCTSKTYENEYYINIESPIAYDGADRYYISYEKGLVKHNMTSDSITVLDKLGTWPDVIYGGEYPGKYSGLFKYRDCIYYNSPYDIKKYEINTGAISTLKTVNDPTGAIYGCFRDGSKIAYSIEPYPRAFDYDDKTIRTMQIECQGAHEWESNYTIDKMATWKEDGIKSKHCKNCGTSSKGIVIPKPETIKLATTAYIYSGKARKPAVTAVYDREGKIIDPVNYTVTYSNNVKAGTATAKVTLSSKMYKGSLGKSFTIKPKDISAMTASLAATAYTYDGTAKKPAAKLSDSTLVKGTDYQVTYSSNKNVGKARAKIAGIGNYTGTIYVYYKINPKKTSIASLTRASGAFTVNWNRQATRMSESRITGYQIRYSRYSKMTSAKAVKVAGYSNLSKKITGLSSGKKYYVQIRTYMTVNGTNYYSAWSPYKYVTTK